MLTLLSLEHPLPQAASIAGRILAIEPNPVRAITLKDLLREHDLVDLAIVGSVEEAIDSIARRVPDLVITSTFLPPADEAALTLYLRQLPGASHVQVLIVPHFTTHPVTRPQDAAGGFRLRRRPAPGPPTCDLEWVRRQIADYLEQARIASSLSVEPDMTYEPLRFFASEQTALVKPELRLVRPNEEEIASLGKEDADGESFAQQRPDRRRERRWSSAELPWLWSARTSSGAELKLVDVSNGGVLVETGAKIAPGSTVDFRLIGKDTDLSVPARVLRSTVSQVDALGVRYYIAAAFARELHIMELAPKSLAGLRAAGDPCQPDLGSFSFAVMSTAARVRFEQELRRLLLARDVLIRHAPVVAADGAESVYFSIPGGSGSVLQVIFERDHEPSAMEFEVLRAAARLAAVVLDGTPARDAAPDLVEAIAG